MRVLFISFCHPWPPQSGGQLRNYHLVRHLADRHEVTLVTLLPAPLGGEGADCPLHRLCAKVIELDARKLAGAEKAPLSLWASPGRRVWSALSSARPMLHRNWHSEGLVQEFRRLRRLGSFDAVWVDRSYFAEAVHAAGFENVVVDVDDVETISFSRALQHCGWYRSKPLHYLELAKLFWHERSLPRKYRRLVVCKEDDRRFFTGARSRVCVVANGVEELPPAPAAKEVPGEVLFLGTMDYPPNIDAAIFFHHEVFPRLLDHCPDARFRVVGRNPEPEVLALHNGNNAYVHANVPDTTPCYEQAALVVAPIRLGSGTRLKVLEALARGKALVATSTAVEGLDLKAGEHLEIADDPDRFAAACARLLNDAAARRRLGTAGRQAVLEKYRWDVIARQAEEALRQAA